MKPTAVTATLSWELEPAVRGCRFFCVIGCGKDGRVSSSKTASLAPALYERVNHFANRERERERVLLVRARPDRTRSASPEPRAPFAERAPRTYANPAGNSRLYAERADAASSVSPPQFPGARNGCQNGWSTNHSRPVSRIPRTAPR